MSEHTPGPWAVVEYGDDEVPNLVIHSDDKMRVCFMATPGSNGDPATIAADAKLIAAAPDLFDACASVWADLADTDDARLRKLAQECRSALGKVMGG